MLVQLRRGRAGGSVIANLETGRVALSMNIGMYFLPFFPPQGFG